MKEKVIHGLGFLTFVLVLMLAVYPVRAQAASYKVVSLYSEKADRKVGKTVFSWADDGSVLYATTSGKKVKLYSAPTGYTINDSVISNGTAVYFSVRNTDNSKKGVIYYCTVAGKKLKKLATTSGNTYAPMAFVGLYNNKLYFTDWHEWGVRHLCYLDLKTRKFKTVSKKVAGGAQLGGKYIVFSTFVGLRDYYMYSYNMTTGKVKKITEGAICYWQLNDKYLYYGIYSDDSSGNKTIIRIKPDGSGKKTLAKKVKEIITFDSTGVTYKNANGKKKTIKF